MLHRGGSEGAHPGFPETVSPPAAKVVLAVAPPPPLSNPTRWGWPHWLAPAYKAGGHRSAHHSLEEYG